MSYIEIQAKSRNLYVSKTTQIIKSSIRVSLLTLVMLIPTLLLAVHFLPPWQEIEQLAHDSKIPDSSSIDLVSLDKIPIHLALALLISEDHRFLSHNGFNYGEIKKSFYDWIKKGERLRGASSLSQQTSRILFLSNEKSIVRKMLEFLITIELESRFSKQDILAFYFSYAQWGEHIFGINQACQQYFGKSPAEVTPGEASILAVILPNPTNILREINSGSISDKTRMKLMRVNIWTNAILAGARLEDIDSTPELLEYFSDKALGAYFYHTWLAQGLDLNSMTEQFYKQLNEAIVSLNSRSNSFGTIKL